MSARRRRAVPAVLLGLAGAALLAWILLLPRERAAPERSVSAEPPAPSPDPGRSDAPPPAAPPPARPDPDPAPPVAGTEAAAAIPSVRVLDARTGEPIDVTYGWPAFRIQGADGRREAATEGARPPDAAGFFPLHAPLPPDRAPDAGESRFLEVDLPGWEIARLPLAGIRGAVDLPLRPLEVSVTGWLEFPAEEVSSAVVEILPPDGAGKDVFARAAGRLDRDGRFEIRGLPEGRWTLRSAVVSAVPGERWDEERVARRAFAKEGGILDLGRLPLVDPVSVRVRVLDEEGDPVGDVELYINRAGKPGLLFTLEGTSGWVTSGPVGSLLGIRTREDEDGWIGVGSLEPGGVYRVSAGERVIEVPVLEEGDAPAGSPPAPEEPRWEIDDVTFTAPAGEGESLDVELRRRRVPAEEE